MTKIKLVRKKPAKTEPLSDRVKFRWLKKGETWKAGDLYIFDHRQYLAPPLSIKTSGRFVCPVSYPNKNRETGALSGYARSITTENR